MNDELTDSQDENFIKLIQEEIIFYKNKLDDWNCYREYSSEPVMNKFKKLYDI